MKIGRIITMFGGGFVLWSVFSALIGILSLWVAASAVTSGVKALSNECDSRYPVEALVHGNWFCAEKPRRIPQVLEKT